VGTQERRVGGIQNIDTWWERLVMTLEKYDEAEDCGRGQAL